MRVCGPAYGGLEALLTFAETPAAGQMAAEDAGKIMHSDLIVGGQSFMAADAPGGMKYEPMKGCALALTYDTADGAKRVFDALGEGGKITMPFGPSFWADGFGMVDDRFGTHWIVNGGMKPMD